MRVRVGLHKSSVTLAWQYHGCFVWATLSHTVLCTYGALFSKLWRIHRVLQMRRQAIMIKQVVWPSLVLFVIALLILGLWTGLDPMQWVREETNEITGESIGQCQSDGIRTYLIPLVIVMLVPTLLTAYMAWRTKDVHEEYSESRWIFIMVFVQCEVILFAVPMIALLRDRLRSLDVDLSDEYFAAYRRAKGFGLSTSTS